MKRYSLCIVIWGLSFLTACVAHTQPNSEAPPAYAPISETSCRDTVGINGRWKLFNTIIEEHSYVPANDEEIVITDCSHIEHYTNGRFTRKESFRLLRVLSYCSDYQLNYVGKNDSVSCINTRRDTLIFGDCSTFETSRFFYKKISN